MAGTALKRGTHAPRSLVSWLARQGINTAARVRGRNAAQLFYSRALALFGPGPVGLSTQHFTRRGEILIHHDDLHDFIFGVAVPFAVERAKPAPAVIVTRAVKAQVGVMEVTVAAGQDGELGTADDKVVIKPVRKKRHFVETPEGGYECLHCGKVYQPTARALEYIEKHVEREHQ